MVGSSLCLCVRHGGERVHRASLCGKRSLSVAVARTVDVGKPRDAVEELLIAGMPGAQLQVAPEGRATLIPVGRGAPDRPPGCGLATARTDPARTELGHAMAELSAR